MDGTISTSKICKKKYVKKACIRCRHTKSGCSNERPCKRCVRLGVGHLCKDATDIKIINYVQYDGIMSKQIHKPGNGLPANNECGETDNFEQNEEDLLNEIERLENDINQQKKYMQELNCSLRCKKLFSGIAITRWGITNTGSCKLLSYSSKFIDIIKMTPSTLQGFDCLHLSPPQYVNNTQKIYAFLRSNVIESVTIKAPILDGNNNTVNAFYIITIECENDKPIGFTVCMEDFNPSYSIYGNIPYFEPIVQTLKQKEQQVTSMNYISSYPSSDFPKFSQKPLITNKIDHITNIKTNAINTSVKSKKLGNECNSGLFTFSDTSNTKFNFRSESDSNGGLFNFDKTIFNPV